MSKKPSCKDKNIVTKSKCGKYHLGEGIFTTEEGTYKALGVTLDEVALNNTVLRVPLSRINSKGRHLPLKVETRLRTSGITKRAPELLNLKKDKSKKRLNMSSSEGSPEKKRAISVSSGPGKQRIIRYKSPAGRSTFKEFIKQAASPEKPTNGATQPRTVLSESGINECNKLISSRFAQGAVKTYHIKKPRKSYRLQFLPEKQFEDRVLSYKFSKLAVDVRSLRLPAPHWKIKIYMKNKSISTIAFTNKQEDERIVTFNALSNVYEIIINNKKACLLGSPLTIENRHDVEVLLDLVHCISAESPMIMYI